MVSPSFTNRGAGLWRCTSLGAQAVPPLGNRTTVQGSFVIGGVSTVAAIAGFGHSKATANTK
jgi:hypothetical protein